ncbi:hypothetical protein [Halovulum marinum]|nr:hypothetical protein [Halovulum marinum]
MSRPEDEHPIFCQSKRQGFVIPKTITAIRFPGRSLSGIPQ